MTETYGCDVAWARPTPTQLTDTGYQFLLGYLSHDGKKQLDKKPLDAFLAAGVKVGYVFEDTANRALSGAVGGKADGEYCARVLREVGYPTSAVVFFAVDFDATTRQFPVIAAYAAAFNRALVNPVGVYGSYALIEHLVTPGHQPVQYGWQTAAWSGGHLSGKAHIYQRNHHTHPLCMAAASFDEDVACLPIPLAGGVVGPPGTHPPVSPAPAKPADPKPPVPAYYTVQAGDTLPSIAVRFHTTAAAIVTLNPQLIKAGDRIMVGHVC